MGGDYTGGSGAEGGWVARGSHWCARRRCGLASNAELGGGTQRAGWGGTGGGGAEAGGRDSGGAKEDGWSVQTIGHSNPSISVLTFRYHI